MFLAFTATAQEKINLAFVGDIMMGTNYPNKSYLMTDGGINLFKDCTHIIQKADCAFGNLEGFCTYSTISINHKNTSFPLLLLTLSFDTIKTRINPLFAFRYHNFKVLDM